MSFLAVTLLLMDYLKLHYTTRSNQTQVFPENLKNTAIEFTSDPVTGNSQFSVDYDMTLDLQPDVWRQIGIYVIKLYLRLLI